MANPLPSRARTGAWLVNTTIVSGGNAGAQTFGAANFVVGHNVARVNVNDIYFDVREVPSDRLKDDRGWRYRVLADVAAALSRPTTTTGRTN